MNFKKFIFWSLSLVILLAISIYAKANFFSSWFLPLKTSLATSGGKISELASPSRNCTWQNPFPTGNNLRGVWGNGRDSFAVGDYGTILHYDGSNLNIMNSGTTIMLKGIWGSALNDIYAVGGTWSGEGIILHYDGQTWRNLEVKVPSLTAIWGCNSQEIFAVGSDPAAGSPPPIYHYNGTSWNLMESNLMGNFFGIWGTGPDDVYVAGYHDEKDIVPIIRTGVLFHYNGTNWSKIENLPKTDRLDDVWGSAFNNIFAVGAYEDEVNGKNINSGIILHFNGSNWTKIKAPTTFNLESICGSGPDDIFAVGGYHDTTGNEIILHYDGNTWNIMDSGEDTWLRAVWGDTPGNFFAVGNYGKFIQFNGTNWSPLTPGLRRDLFSVWGCASDNVFAVGVHEEYIADAKSQELLHQGYRVTQEEGGAKYLARGVILNYNGSSWRDISPERADWLSCVWGSGPEDVFAVGDYTILHYDGQVWREMSSGNTNQHKGVWGSGPNNVFAVGGYIGDKDGESIDAGVIMHYDGDSWSQMPIPTKNWLNAIWGSGPDSIFAVGSHGAILHFNGSTWSLMESGYSGRIGGIWGASADDIFAAGSDGILHYNGKTWERMLNVIMLTPYKVWGSGLNNVYAVGDDGLMLHYNGSKWKIVPTGTNTIMLRSIWGSSADDIFVIGEGGAILHY